MLFAAPWTVTCQAPLSMEFSRQEYWSGLPFPSPGIVQPRDKTCVSWISCIVRWVLYCSCLTLHDSRAAAHQASLSLTISRSLPTFIAIASVMPSNHFIQCPLLLLLPSISPSIKIFSNELAVHSRWPKYWSFSFSISPCNEYSGLISFKIDRFVLLAVQETLRSLLQHLCLKASILRCSALFMVKLSQPYVTPGKTITLTIQTFVSKVMSLLFNTMSRFVIVFLLRSIHLLISWLRSPPAMILEPKKRKSVTASTFSPISLP